MLMIICTWKSQRMGTWNLKLMLISWTWGCTTFHNFLWMLKKRKKSWQVCDWLAKWLIMSGYMDLRRPRVYRRSNVGLVHTSDWNHDSESECLNFERNGQNISFIPDTGSQVTILPETAYDKLKEHWPTLQKCTRPVYSYMSSKPLNIRGQFYGEIPWTCV